MRILATIVAAVLLAGCATAAKRQEVQNQVDFHYRMGMAHLQDNAFQEALVEFREAEKADPKDTKALFAMGHAHYSQGDYAQARSAMERVLAIDKGNGEALNYLGNILEKQGETDAALDAFSRAAQIPDYRTPHFALHNQARILLQKGERAEAEQALLAAVRRVPEYYPARADLARLYLDDGRWADSVAQWRTFIDLRPDLAEAHYHLGRAYMGLNQIGPARTELNTFIEQAGPDDPLYPDAQALLDDLAR